MEQNKSVVRLYYPLSEAAKKLGCSERDIIHFGATFRIVLCVFIKRHSYGNNSIISGQYIIERSNLDEAQFDDDMYIVVNSVMSLASDDIIRFGDNPYVTDRKFLHVMLDDLYEFNPNPFCIESTESNRTKNRKGEIIPALLKMIPEFNGYDIDKEPVNRISDILEATAAAKGIDLVLPDKNTMAKYLGRK